MRWMSGPSSCVGVAIWWCESELEVGGVTRSGCTAHLCLQGDTDLRRPGLGVSVE